MTSAEHARDVTAASLLETSKSWQQQESEHEDVTTCLFSHLSSRFSGRASNLRACLVLAASTLVHVRVVSLLSCRSKPVLLTLLNVQAERDLWFLIDGTATLQTRVSVQLLSALCCVPFIPRAAMGHILICRNGYKTGDC